METVMHKRLANPTTFQAKTSGRLGSWYSALKGWSEARALRKQERQHEELVSELPSYVLYKIGESRCRPRCSSSDIWESLGKMIEKYLAQDRGQKKSVGVSSVRFLASRWARQFIEL